MSAHDDIRDTLRTEAGRYDPADDGWAGISAGVRAAQRRRRLQGGALGGLAVAVALAVGLSGGGGGGTDVDAGGEPAAVASAPEVSDSTAPTTVATTTTTTTTSPTTTTVPGVAAVAPFPGIWPFASQEAVAAYEDGDARFGDPRTTAAAFARDYVGMLDPVVVVVGERTDDERESAQVELRPRGEGGEPAPDGGPSTTVLLGSYETSSGSRVWTVLGAQSRNLQVDEPSPGDEIVASGNVVRVRGRGTGYEGHVRAEVRQDGMQLDASLGSEIGITGSMGELGPLSLDVAFDTPTEPGGAVVVTTDTGLDGVGVPEFTVVRIRFAETGGTPGGGPTATDCRVAEPEGEPGADEMDVTVFFVCNAAVAAGDGGDAPFVPVVRRLPKEATVLGATLRTFLAGTSSEGDEAGLTSFTSNSGTAASVTLDGGTAVVDFDASLTTDANGASTSAGSVLFRGALDRTVLQFPTVEAVEYRLGGSCDAFWQWQQVGDCRLVTRDDL